MLFWLFGVDAESPEKDTCVTAISASGLCTCCLSKITAPWRTRPGPTSEDRSTLRRPLEAFDSRRWRCCRWPVKLTDPGDCEAQADALACNSAAKSCWQLSCVANRDWFDSCRALVEPWPMRCRCLAVGPMAPTTFSEPHAPLCAARPRQVANQVPRLVRVAHTKPALPSASDSSSSRGEHRLVSSRDVQPLKLLLPSFQ